MLAWLEDAGGKGHIWITFSLQHEMILFEVMDDGIGLSRSKELKKEDQMGHKSLALAITHERIDLLNRNLKQKIRFEIIDRSEEEKGKQGTLVRFSIPYMDYISQGNLIPNR